MQTLGLFFFYVEPENLKGYMMMINELKILKILKNLKWDVVPICILIAVVYSAGISFWVSLCLFGIMPKTAAVFRAIWFIGGGAVVILLCVMMLLAATFIIWRNPFLSKMNFVLTNHF